MINFCTTLKPTLKIQKKIKNSQTSWFNKFLFRTAKVSNPLCLVHHTNTINMKLQSKH